MKIGLLGDHIIDTYVYGKCERLSPESPIPVFLETHREQKHGGVENVFLNLLSFGVEVQKFCSQNSTKTRYVVDNHIMFRTDQERYTPSIHTDFPFNSQYVILSDYNKGFLHCSEMIIRNLKSKNNFVIVDPKNYICHYRNANVVKLNEKEYSECCPYGADHARKEYGIDTFVITRGPKPVIIIDDLGEREIEVESHPVADVTGAGDVFIAAMTVYLSKGNTVDDAVKMASKLASISVTKFGTYVLTKEDIRAVTPKIVFTNGCFDIIHRAHVEYLRKSRLLGDKLIVGLNSDASVRRLKGYCRPINNENDRKYVLENLKFVDEVIVFDEDTPYELIKKIKPDIITKGGDYKYVTDVVGHDLAEVVLIPFVDGYSTTKILEKL
jgi:D-beta-D-heptose 7-phosphate kinase/D-beta-D-heptose 1-phosphate adenosyltransferase